MTGAEILRAFEALGAVVRLTPAGVVDVDAPAVPELERLVAAVQANRSDVVAELRRHTVPSLPGRAERPCLACGRECSEGVLFETEACFEAWKAKRAARRAERRATRPAMARTATSPAPSIPPESSPDGGAA